MSVTLDTQLKHSCEQKVMEKKHRCFFTTDKRGSPVVTATVLIRWDILGDNTQKLKTCCQKPKYQLLLHTHTHTGMSFQMLTSTLTNMQQLSSTK